MTEPAIATTLSEKPRRWILYLGGATLAVLALAWSLNTWELHKLQDELHAIALERIATLTESEEGMDVPTDRIGAEVTVARPYVFFGPPVGKISVYIESRLSGKEPLIAGYEFILERQVDAHWLQTESGRCASEQCSIDGRRILDAMSEPL